MEISVCNFLYLQIKPLVQTALKQAWERYAQFHEKS